MISYMKRVIWGAGRLNLLQVMAFGKPWNGEGRMAMMSLRIDSKWVFFRILNAGVRLRVG